MATYWEKLKDPRWQRRRLEIMSLAEFQCVSCGADRVTLNVHHTIYRRGADPWDYADHELECLCEKCHEQNHQWRSRLDEALAMDGNTGTELEQVAGYAEGLHWRHYGPDPDASIQIMSPEHASGVCDAFGDLFWEDVVRATDKENRIPVAVLFQMLEETKKKK